MSCIPSASEIYQIAVEPATAAGPPCVRRGEFRDFGQDALTDTVVRDFASRLLSTRPRRTLRTSSTFLFPDAPPMNASHPAFICIRAQGILHGGDYNDFERGLSNGAAADAERCRCCWI